MKSRNNILLHILLATSLALTSLSAISASQLEIIDGTLIDHSTGLVWRTFTLPEGATLPHSAQLGDWQVASGTEIENLLPQYLLQRTVPKGSDVYLALSYFAANTTSASCMESGQSQCFRAWATDWPYTGEPAHYNEYSIGYGTDAEGNFTNYSSISTLGGYSESFCSPSLCTHITLFEVHAVPEPPIYVLLLLAVTAIASRSALRLRGA